MTGSRQEPGDDPWEGVVFDEDFVKGGRHEPPARTRESIARYGGERTSWRQGALLEPAPVRRRRPHRRRRGGWIAVAVVAVIAVGWFVVGRVSPAPVIPAVAAPSVGPAIVDPAVQDTVTSGPPSTAAQTSTAVVPTDPAPAVDPAVDPSTAGTTDVYGVTELDAVGTCYLDPLSDDGGVQLSTVDCTEAHNLELVSHRSATDADSYPDARYWDQVVGDACEADLTAYLGTPPSAWPVNLSAYWLIPQEESWAFGDRHVYCLFYSDTTVTTPVRG